MKQGGQKKTYHHQGYIVVVLAFFCLLCLPSALSFSLPTTSGSITGRKSSSSSLNSSTEEKVEAEVMVEQSSSSNRKTFPTYTDGQLKAALDGLLHDSKDPAFDGRHLFGYGDPNHQLSKLQSITATRILDYETYLVRTNNDQLAWLSHFGFSSPSMVLYMPLSWT